MNDGGNFHLFRQDRRIRRVARLDAIMDGRAGGDGALVPVCLVRPHLGSGQRRSA